MTASRVLCDRRFGGLGQPLGEHVEQIARAQPLGCGDGDRIAETELVELGREPGLQALVHLVGGHYDRHRTPAQLGRQLGVARAQAGARVDHQQRQVGLGDRRAGLAAHGLRHVARLLLVDPAGVDQSETHAVPVRLHLPCGRG